MSRLCWLAAATLAGIACLPLPAHALLFSVSYDAAFTAPMRSAFDSILQDYQRRFTDPVTISLQVNAVSTGLASSSTVVATNFPYTTWRNALAADATSADDATALAHLPATDPLGDGLIRVRSANLKALGLGYLLPAGLVDSTLSFNVSIIDFDPTTVAGSGLYDFVSVAEHELDEALGIGSALTGLSDNTPVPASNLEPFDYFRYTATGARSLTTDPRAAAYFSIDGSTLLAQFNQSGASADRNDWINGNFGCPAVQPLVQDAFGCPNQTPSLGLPELTALDVLGWDLAVPEPAGIPMFLLGFAMLAGLRWPMR